MRKTFEKDGKIRSFDVVDWRVMATIEIGGEWVANPTLAAFLADGWREYIAPVPEPILPTIEELVEGKLRERYTINQEFEVQRKRDTDPQSFEAYYDYVEECIIWANKQPHRDA
jgi:hypothetical protein